MYEILTLNELCKNVSIMYQYKGIFVQAKYSGQFYVCHLGPHGNISNVVYS